MTLYRVTVGSHEYQIMVSDNALSVNGEQIQANLIPLNEVGAYLLRLGDRKRELSGERPGSGRLFGDLTRAAGHCPCRERHKPVAQPDQS